MSRKHWPLVALLMVIALVAPAALTSAPSHTPSLRDSIFILDGFERDGETACTAFAITPHTFFTAGHCVKDADGTYDLEDADGRTHAVEVVAVDMDRDAALLHSEMSETPLPLGNDPDVGDPVTTLAAVGGEDLFYLVGQDAGTYNEYLAAQVFGMGPGGSGSPLLCDQKVCGLVVGMLPESHLTVAIPVSGLEGMLHNE